jgi:hypothetical protein
MSKIRSDALWARLTPAQREELLTLCVEQGASLADGLELLRGWEQPASRTALSRFISLHGLPWRVERARAAAETARGGLPKDWEAQRQQGLAMREFELTFRDLSNKEWVALKKMELDERAMRLKEKIEPRKLEIASRRVVLLEENAAKAKSALEGLKSKGGLTADTLKTIEEAAGLL